jgi:transposase
MLGTRSCLEGEAGAAQKAGRPRWKATVDGQALTRQVEHLPFVIDNAGKVVGEAELPADAAAAHAYLNDHSPSLAAVALETGTTSIHLARSLGALGYPVAIYDALKVHRFLQLKQNKTDPNDARGLAEVARVGGERFPKVYLRPAGLSLLRSKLVIRERLINEAAMMSLFHSYGVRAEGRVSSSTSLRRIVAEMLTSAERAYDLPIRQLVTPLLNLSVHLRREELRLERELKEYATHDEVCRRLMEIPGVGVITAVSFVTAIGDPARFSSVANVGAYLGLTPKVWRTGSYAKRRGISKLGSGMTRKHLHSAARQALDARTESPLQEWARGLADRTNRRRAIVALARKLAVVMLTMWKNGSRFYFSPPTPQHKNRG